MNRLTAARGSPSVTFSIVPEWQRNTRAFSAVWEGITTYEDGAGRNRFSPARHADAGLTGLQHRRSTRRINS
jgi:hypothetical protein